MRKAKGQNEIVRPALHQSELGVIVLALGKDIETEPKSSTILQAFERVRRKLNRNRNSNSFNTEDHRREVLPGIAMVDPFGRAKLRL